MCDKYKNLRDKTVFDFCNDPKLLEEIVETTNKQEYIFGLWVMEAERARAIADFAERSNDKELLAAVEKEFGKELSNYEATFNE